MRRECITRVLCGLVVGTLLALTQNGASTGASTGSFSTSLAISNVVAVVLQSGNVSISWNTSDNSSSRVFYDTVSHPDTASYAFQSGIDPTPVLLHAVNLTGLQGPAVYHFRAMSTVNVSGTLFNAISGDLTFEMPSPVVNLSVVLQGGSRPDGGWVVPLTVKFFPPGTANITTATANYTFTQNTTKVGSTAVASVTGIILGTYDITVKSAHTLLNVKQNVVISQLSTNVTMGTLLEGNAYEINAPNAGIINISDFTTLSATYGKSFGASGYDARADFDRNNIVNISDFTLLSVNYQKTSPITVP